MHVGLRPRLRPRPSLYDLIHNKNIDQISTSLDRLPAPEIEAARIALPPSPLLSPQAEPPFQPPPPRITLHEASESDDEVTVASKMPSVSQLCCTCGRDSGLN